LLAPGGELGSTTALFMVLTQGVLLQVWVVSCYCMPVEFVLARMANDDNNPNHLWCVCRQPAGEDKFMICCDRCHE